jgi:Tol biopolymer transport system component
MNTKKIFIIVGILFILTLVSLLVYNLLGSGAPGGGEEELGGALPSAPSGRGGETTPTGSPGGNTSGGTGGSNNPGATPKSLAALKIKPISQERILAPTLGNDGKTVKYFSRANGNIYQSDFDGGSLKKISSANLNNLIKALWSPDKEKVIGIFSEKDKLKKYFYDYVGNRSSLLNEKIAYLAWSPDSKKIAYHFVDPSGEQNNVSTANPDGTNWKNIFKTRLDNVIIEWPIKEKISLRTPPSGLAQGVLYSINSETGDFFKIISEAFGLLVNWSPKGDKILFSSTDSRGKNPTLNLSDEKGANFKNLNLAGLADKCVWSKDDKTIFCALPQEISQNATWPDDYYKGLVVLSDDIYKIDLEANRKTKIIGSTDEISYDAQELFLSPKEDYLFFINRSNGLLYSLKTQ